MWSDTSLILLDRINWLKDKSRLSKNLIFIDAIWSGYVENKVKGNIQDQEDLIIGKHFILLHLFYFVNYTSATPNEFGIFSSKQMTIYTLIRNIIQN